MKSRMPPVVCCAPCVVTHFRGPTDHRGARIVARHMNTRARVVVPYNHGLDSRDNHEIAARKLLDHGLPYSQPLLCCSVYGGGFAWMVGRPA